MARLTGDIVAGFREQEEIKAAVGGLPPGFIVGFTPTVSDGKLTISAGIANILGQRVSVGTTTITFQDWIAYQLGGFNYYLYLTLAGTFKVDNIDPEYSEEQYYPIHRISGWRYICTFFFDTDKQIEYTEITDLIVGISVDPSEGDRRALVTSDQILLQEWTEGAWSTVNGIKIGGAIAGIFLSLMGCRWLVNPEVDVTAEENELFPGPGEVFSLDNTYNNQFGIDTWAAHTSVSFTAATKKFGTHALTCVDPTFNGVLTTNADAEPKEPHAMSAWCYSGSAFAAMNWEMGWQFGWDGSSTTYGSYVRLEIGATGILTLHWHDDYDSETDSQVITTLTAATWYHIALVWDYDADDVHVVVNGTVTTVAIYDFNETGLRSSEQFRSAWVLDKDQGHVIDDVAVVKNHLIDPDVFVQHYNHGVAWSYVDLNAKDLIIRPATGGRVMINEAQARGVHVSTSDPTSGDGEDGELWFVREA